jgi:predicted HTH domain antitoxin
MDFLRFIDEYVESQELMLPESERGPSQPWIELKPYFDDVLGPIENDLAILEELYVDTRAREYDNDFLTIEIFKLPPIEIEKIESTANEINFITLFRNVNPAQGSGVIYIISPIGRGKTTFLHYQLRIELSRKIRDFEFIPVILDIRECSDLDDFKHIFLEKIDDVITNSYSCFNISTDEAMMTETHKVYCTIFAQELRKRGIESRYVNKEQDRDLHKRQSDAFAELRIKSLLVFNTNRLQYIRSQPEGQDKMLILAVDNSDQHLALFGAEIIVFTHAVARRLELPLILTLRDTSFRRNNPAFAISGYTPRYLNLSRLDLDEMLNKRLEKASSLAFEDEELKNLVAQLAYNFSRGEKGIVKGISKLITEWIGSLGNHNNREILKLVEIIFSSFHLTSSRFKRQRMEENDYLSHSFATLEAKVKMAILLGAYGYYNDSANDVYILNLFDCGNHSLSCNNILRLKILQYLKLRGDTPTTGEQLVNKVVEAIGPEAGSSAMECIKKFVERGLINIIFESDDFKGSLVRLPFVFEEHKQRPLYINFCGLFHLDELLDDPIYLDEMKLATFLPENVFNKIFKKYSKTFQPFRKERQNSTLGFLYYLIQLEEKDNDSVRLSNSFNVPYIMKKQVYNTYDKFIKTCDSGNRRSARKVRQRKAFA